MKRHKTEHQFFQAFFHKNRLLFALILALQLLASTFQALCSWVLGAVTDAMAAGDWNGLIQIGIGILIVLPIVAVLSWIGHRTQAAFTRRAMTQYKALAFSKISAKGISAFARENTAQYLSALTNDTTTIENQYLTYIPQLVEQLAGFVLALAIMLYYSPLLTLVLLVTCALPVLVSILMSGKYAALEQQVSDENGRYTAGIKDLLSGFAVIKSFKAEQETGRIFEKSSSRAEKAKAAKRNYGGLLSALSMSASLAAQLGTFLAGGLMAVRGHITPGTVLIFVNLCNSVLGPIQSVPEYLAGIRASRALVRKLAQLTEENAQRGGKALKPVLKDAITMKNLNFSYEEDKPVLRDVNLTLEAGKKYAIVGGSGSGKSTLLNLLMGGYDNYRGSITIDGSELRSIDPDSLYDLMSLIGQNVFLFDSTIRENITMFRDFPAEAVDSAAMRSGLASVIAAKGVDYRCGENGVGLSGGERQRVSIARSLLRGTPVLMLDEATAALDNQTAFEVTDAILKLDGLTRIVVTHRLEEKLLQQYDSIIVLRDGHITEQGTYDDLMARTGYFYSLYNVTN